jgi:hypothetical protein
MWCSSRTGQGGTRVEPEAGADQREAERTARLEAGRAEARGADRLREHVRQRLEVEVTIKSLAPLYNLHTV